MAASEGSVSSWLSVIPSIYYDVIARVTPGAIVLFAMDVVRTNLNPENGTLPFLTLLGGGYVVGMALTPLHDIVVAPIYLLTCVESVRSRLHIPKQGLPRGLNDQVGLVRPELGATLAKMQGETVLCGNLAAGYLILWICPIKSWLTPYKTYSYDSLLSGFLFLLLVASFRYIMYVGRQAEIYRYFSEKKLI
jgi:hypothetical protein